MLSVKVDRNPILSIRDLVDRGPTLFSRNLSEVAITARIGSKNYGKFIEEMFVFYNTNL